MIIDNFLVMSDAQDEVHAQTTHASTSHIDTLTAGDAISPGARLHVLVNELFETADSATLTIALQTGSTTAYGTTLFTTAALAVSALTAGAVLVDIVVPKGALRYLRMLYTVGTGSFSEGKIDARIVIDTAKTMDKNL